MLATIVLCALLPATFAKFAVPIEKISESLHGSTWDTTYRMANLAGPIAICDNAQISAQNTGQVTQEIANSSAPEAQLVTSEFTAKGFWFWVNSTGWDADSVSNDMTTFVNELGSTHSEIIGELNSPSVYGCSVEPYCDFQDSTSSPCNGGQFCTLFVCMFTSYSTEAGRSRAAAAAKSRREVNFLPMVDGLPQAVPKAKALSLRDSYPRNATSYYNYLAQPNVRLQLAGNKDQEDVARMIMDHFQCDAFLDPKANMENIPWDTVPTYKDRNIDLMRRRSQLKPIFERVFVIDEAEMSEEEKPTYREDTVVRLLQSTHRYANFVKMRFERVGCAYIPQCSSTGNQEFPLAVMVCVTVQPYSGPTPPPAVRRSSVVVPTVAPQAPAVSPVAPVEVPATGTAEQLQTVESIQMTTQSVVVEETVTATTVVPTVVEVAPEPAVEPETETDGMDPLVEDMTNQKVKI